jgi:hypothetical protein
MKHHLNPTSWIGIALLTLVPPATLSGVDLDPILIGEWSPHPPGNARALEVRDNYAYVVSDHDGESSGNHLLVFDVTDRTDPQLKGYCAIPHNIWRGAYGWSAVALVGHYAYVPTDSQGLQIVDVSDPTNPVPTQLVRPYIDEHGNCITRGVAVIGNYAYTCVATDGSAYNWNLHILDVSDPAAPVAVGSCAFTGELQRLVGAGNHAYVCNSRSLQIIDITQPSQPRRVGEFQVWEGADVAISGHYAYVAIETGLSVLDISNPAHPFQIGTFRTQNRVLSVAVEGNIVCLGVRREGILVLDVSNPAQPRELTFHDRHTSVLDLLIEGDYLYLADWTAGLHMVDLSTPGQTTVVGGYPLDGRAQDVVLSKHHAYVAAGGAGLWVIDVRRPDRPQRVGHLDTTGFARSVFVKGQHAYLAQTHSGSGLKESLLVIDVAQPANPRQVGSFATRGGGHDVEVVDDYAYLANDTEGLRIIRVADPTQPELVATVFVDGRVAGVTVANEHVYLYQNGQLITIKVSPPTQPQSIGSLPDIEGTVFKHSEIHWSLGPGLTVQGNFAYLGGHGLAVFDLSDPTTPVLASWCWGRPWRGGSAITAVDGRVFMNGSIVDVTDPLNPKRVGSLSGEGFAVAGDHIYVAAKDNGLRIYHLGRPANPQRLGWVEFPGGQEFTKCLALAGDHAYVATWHGWEATYPVQLHVVDTSNPGAPSNLGAFARFADGGTTAMMAYDQHLYVVGSSPIGLRVYNLQDPTAPRFVGHSALPQQHADTIQIANHHAYVLMDDRIEIIDISDPARPTRVGDWTDTGIGWVDYRGIALEGNRLYLAGHPEQPSQFPRCTLTILDINDPRHPQLLGRYWSEDITRGLATSGDYAYVVYEDPQRRPFFLDAVDVSDPGNPRMLGRAPLVERFYEMNLTVSGHYAYLTAIDGVLCVVDVRNPSSPRLLGSNFSSAMLWRVAFHEGKLYAAGAVNAPALIVYDLYRPPLRLDPPEFLGLDGWRLLLWGAPGQSLRLQRSPDLHTWEDWQTTIGSDLPQEFIDDTAGSRARQFYRAVSP